MGKFHGNSRQSKKKHHLYEIRDREENNTFKFGISGQELNDDGSSPRANTQVNLYNRVVGWFRFFSIIREQNLEGREKAETIERQYIDQHEKEFGKRPRGNP